MAIYLISYDLGVPETTLEYKRVIDYIKSLGSWAKPLYSQWLVQTPLCASSIRDNLMKLIDSNDKLLILDVSNDDWASYNLLNVVTDWMKHHIKQ